MNSREATEVIISSRASMAWAAHGLSRMQTRLSRLGLGAAFINKDPQIFHNEQLKSVGVLVRVGVKENYWQGL